jgi:L-glyceraldehyde 3-phosphate reductase
VRSGKALYAGLSNYNAEQTAAAARLLRELGAPCLIHQPRYHLFERSLERDLGPLLVNEGIGGIAFCPLAQGVLTNRYLGGIPADSRVARDGRFLKVEHLAADKLARVRALDALARTRGQSLAQMSLAWVLRHPAITSALIGASKVAQIEENLGALQHLEFSSAELAAIERIVGPSA